MLTKTNTSDALKSDQTDALILAAASTHFTKIAVIVAKVYDAFEADGHALTKDLAQTIAERIYVLVDNGQLESKGNIRRWRDADIRLPTDQSSEKPAA